MFEAKIKSITIIVAATLLSISAFAQVGGTVVDQADGSPVAGAAVTIKGNQAVWDVTDSLGRFKLKATGGTLQITCLGYKTLTTAVRKDGRYSLAQDSFAINEVVVTATESHGLTSSSRIGQDAIAHIQPSSFADLLELLPGGRSVDPSFSTPKTIDLRAVSVSGDNYNTSSLGTRFLIDGVPVNNDANLQTTPAYSNYGSSFVNAGVDMRTITTEDVESVEIIRGIPSVEYGDLTSGLVNIKRRKGGNDTRARFKADMKSKLFYLGKDLEWGKTDKLTMNFSGNFLDSRADPRNTRQNYKRLTGSYRIGKTWTGELVRTLSGSLDYTGSFDNQKSDKNLDFGDCGPIETYKSNYSRFALGGEYTVRSKSLKSFFQSLDITGSLTYEKDLIDRWKFVEYSSPMPLSTSLEEGEFDVTIVPYKYEATLKVDGKPFYAYLNGTAKFRKDLGSISNTFKAGAQWNVNKNFGKGTIFDPERPFSVDMNVRPRDYSSIPATHQMSAFIEDNSVWTFGNGFKAEWLAGVRVAAMAGAGKEYSVNMKPYFDPRLNLRLEKSLGKDVKVGLSGGAGWHTKFPTMDQLYPDPIYYDVTQMNYWPVEENLRRINVYVLKINPTNFGLKAARNFKWEIAADVQVGREFSFNIDYFREDRQEHPYRPAFRGDDPVGSGHASGGIFIQHERQPHPQGRHRVHLVRSENPHDKDQGHRQRCLVQNEVQQQPADILQAFGGRGRQDLSLRRLLQGHGRFPARGVQHELYVRHPDPEAWDDLLDLVPVPMVHRKPEHGERRPPDILHRQESGEPPFHGRIRRERNPGADDPGIYPFDVPVFPDSVQYEHQPQGHQEDLPRQDLLRPVREQDSGCLA